MPAMADTNGAKWLYSTTQTADGVISGTEAMGIHELSECAESALRLAWAHALHDVSIAQCITENNDVHSVCIIGAYVVDNRQEWLMMRDDLPYVWI